MSSSTALPSHVMESGAARAETASLDLEERKALGLWSMCGLALVMGVVTGLGAVFFRALIGLVHNLFFFGHASFTYEASRFTPASPWGLLVFLVPVIGSFGVTFIVNTFAPEAKGHGVPEVMDAIYYGRGIIRPVVAAAKSVASALAAIMPRPGGPEKIATEPIKAASKLTRSSRRPCG